MSASRIPFQAVAPSMRGLRGRLTALCLPVVVILCVLSGYDLGRVQQLYRDAAGLRRAVAEIAAAQSLIWYREELQQMRLNHVVPVGFQDPAAPRRQAHGASRAGGDPVKARAAQEWMAGVAAGERRLLANRLSSVESSAHRVAYAAVAGALIEVTVMAVIAFLLLRDFYGRESFGKRRRRALLQRDSYSARTAWTGGSWIPTAHRNQAGRAVFGPDMSAAESTPFEARLIIEVDSGLPDINRVSQRSDQTAEA